MPAGEIVCAVPWPTCPDCLGEPLFTSGGEQWCQRCGQRWPAAPLGALCGRTATHRIADTSGGTSCVCDSHAELARRQIVGAVVEALADADR
jgi:hypothetical protein